MNVFSNTASCSGVARVRFLGVAPDALLLLLLELLPTMAEGMGLLPSREYSDWLLVLKDSESTALESVTSG